MLIEIVNYLIGLLYKLFVLVVMEIFESKEFLDNIIFLEILFLYILNFILIK